MVIVCLYRRCVNTVPDALQNGEQWHDLHEMDVKVLELVGQK